MACSRSSDESHRRPDDLSSEGSITVPSQVPSEATLAKAHLSCLRWKNTLASVCLHMPIAFVIGGAPLVDYMNADTEYPWLAPGVTQPALMNFVGNVLIQQFVGSFAQGLSPRGIFIASLFSFASPASIGISTFPGCVAVQYIGAVLTGVSFALALQYRSIVMQWWSLDDRAIHGAVIVSLLVGLQIVACTLTLAWLLSSLGLARTMFVFVGILAALEVFPLWLAVRGELGSPDMILATGSKLAGASTKDASAAPAATRLWTSKAFWHLQFHAAAAPFSGFGMKALSASIFQVSYGTSFLSSSYLSAITLSGYISFRVVSPLVVKRLPVIAFVTAVMVVNALLFALYPTIVVTCSKWVLVGAKTIAAGNFAGLQAVQELLIMKAYGPALLGRVQAALGTAQFIGFAAGPLIGQYSHMLIQDPSDGAAAYKSFFPFFYACAAIAALGAINMLCLGVGLAGEEDSLNDEKKEEQSHEAV